MKLKVPVFYLVDSAGARITDQLDMFRIAGGRTDFHNQVKLSGMVPQVCILFDLLRRVEHIFPLFVISLLWSIKMPPCILVHGWQKK